MSMLAHAKSGWGPPHTRFRNRHSAEQTIEVPSDAPPTQTIDMDAAIAENMEHEDQDIDEDESDEGIQTRIRYRT